MQLLLIRHPQPMLDKRHCYGASDIAVAPEVLQSCCERLLPQLPRGVAIVSSPLQRCAQLAQALAKALGQEAVVLQAGLREMDFGTWERRAWDDIAWSEVEAWNQDLLHYAPGGGECLLTVARRMWEVFADLQRRQAEQLIVICHAGTIRMFLACAAWQSGQVGPAHPDAAALEAIALQAAATRTAISYGEVIRLDVATA
ncbi:histidine phosphatase family protein [Herbaspirillum sp. NPDC087042]|uniref:histidine phosphatase family protein n=1 Tax=Herbaspirillum sp. NPDC087042 TaxID=3364004 RepID=UPI00381C8BF6